jgi:hypothetical protein
MPFEKCGHRPLCSCRDGPTKKPGAKAGFSSKHRTRATAYPAGMQGSGRRAREVMPAAIRALDRISAADVVAFIEA